MNTTYNNIIQVTSFKTFFIFFLFLLQAMERVDENLDYIRLAQLSDGFSGSDLREICRTASVYRMRELMANLHDESVEKELRPRANEDLLKSLAKLRESRYNCSKTILFGS